MQRKRYIILYIIFILIFFSGCLNNNSKDITIISRENGSGTRSAFTDILNLIVEDSEGNKKDITSLESIVQNSTNGVMTTVINDINGIGYISFGSLNNKIKAVEINNTPISIDNIRDNTYPISRPFSLVYNSNDNILLNDFLNFCLSESGQNIIIKEGFVNITSTPEAYSPSNINKNLIISGSTSVSPIIDKLVEEYIDLNPDSKIEVLATGSSAGIQGVLEDTVDLGMVSRELNEDEAKSLFIKNIAKDGIAVIVNKNNSINNLTFKELRDIYTDKISSWDSIGGDHNE